MYVVVDRLAINPESRSRLVDSIEICYREGHGEALLEFVADAAGPAERLRFNERFECKNDGTLYQEPEPRLFLSIIHTGLVRDARFGNTIDFDLNPWCRIRVNPSMKARFCRGPSRVIAICCKTRRSGRVDVVFRRMWRGGILPKSSGG